MTDKDTLELRRMVDADPVDTSLPDLPALIHSGRRVRARRRALQGVGGGVALGAAAALVVPLLALTGGSAPAPATDKARDTSPAPAPSSVAAQPAPSSPPCGVLSCVHAASSSVEDGEVIGELEVGALPGGATEVIYVARKPGAGQWAGQIIDVLSSGYRVDGQLRRTAWALQPGADGPDAPRFWSAPELANGRPGENDHYAVLGYVDGSPEEVTWSRSDGASGAVDGILRLDGYTAFYVSQPMPSDYVAPPPATRNADGSVTILTDEGPRTVRSGDVFPRGLLMGDATEFAPDLTIHTSDGWSCSFEDCGRG